jgi:succinate dehydrogenase / fumarate reductase, cytochrome b subunit
MLLYLKSSIAKKFVMGLSGMALAGFVLSHMLANLLIFEGGELLNKYGHTMTTNPLYPLIAWGLVGIFVLHGFMGILLAYENNAARRGSYQSQASAAKSSSVASRTMIFSGTLLLVFIPLHLAEFKYGEYYSVTYDGVTMRDLHRLVIEKFQHIGYVFWYVVAMLGLGVHLRHGFSSAFQSLGFNHPRHTPLIKIVGIVYAVIVAAGFISQPLYVYLIHKG